MEFKFKEYTIPELAEDTGRNVTWLYSKAQIIATNCGFRRIGKKTFLFPESAKAFIDETWKKKTKKTDETEIENGN